VPALCEHLAVFVADEPGALVFPGQQGQPLRRSNFNRMSAWPYAVSAIGADGLHVHDLRHTGNQFAASSGAALRDTGESPGATHGSEGIYVF
jgi:integrase